MDRKLAILAIPEDHAGRANRWVAIACAFAVVAAAGCGDDDDDPITPGEPARIVGRVAGAGVFQKSGAATAVEGAIVSAARIESNGTLSSASPESTVSDAGGEFSVDVNLHGARNLVVIATKDSLAWRSVVTAESRSGSAVTAQPLNDESTVEADVLARVVAHGVANAVYYADVAADVDGAVTAAVKGNATAIDRLASAIEAESEGHVLFLGHPSVGVSQARIAAIARGRAAAQERLETDLHAAGDSPAAIDAAYDAFHQAYVEAYVDTGVSAGIAAQARESGARVLLRSSSLLDAPARFALARAAARVRLAPLRESVRARLAGLGAAPGELAAATEAAATLSAALEDAGSGDELDAAFAAYHDAVLGTLAAVAETHAAAIVSMDTAIRAAGGAKQALQSAIGLAASTLDVADAYADFGDAVAALVESTLATASAAEVDAIAEVLAVINMSFDAA
jgi:hypothetical protein